MRVADHHVPSSDSEETLFVLYLERFEEGIMIMTLQILSKVVVIPTKIPIRASRQRQPEVQAYRDDTSSKAAICRCSAPSWTSVSSRIIRSC